MSLGFTTGLRAMLTARTAMSVIGHNLANQNTPGYSRQVALLASTMPVPGPLGTRIGSGVSVSQVYSVVNEALLARIRTELSHAGRFGAEATLFGNLEAVLGDLSDNGIAAKLHGFFDGAGQAAAAPEDDVLRQNFLAAAEDLALGFRTRYASIQDMRSTSLLQVDALVKDANQMLKQVAALNGQIKQLTALGIEPGDLKDQRSVVLQQLSESVGATAVQLTDGTMTVSVGGATLVTGANAGEMEARLSKDGGVEVVTGKGGLKIQAAGGQLGGVLALVGEYLGARLDDLDAIARNLILEANKIHATGVPASGPFQSLVSSHGVSPAAVKDPYGYPLADSGLPFPVEEGTLTIAVSDLATGDVTHHEIAIDPQQDSVGDLLDKLNAIPELNAFVDGVGKLHLTAASGYGFDFSQRIDAAPVEGETFGSTKAMLATGAFPAALSNGATLDISVDGGAPQTVTFNAADFADIGNATAAEVAAVINAQTSGVTASVVDGRLVLHSDTAGAASSLSITDGASSPNAALQLPLSAQGADAGVTVEVSGHGGGEIAGDYTFTPNMDGEIGVTPGLAIEVRDASGLLVTTLQVGEGYEPGASLEVFPGVNVSFSAGSVAASSGQFFDLHVPGDTDTGGLLGAFGLNNLFDGTGAADIELAARLQDHPELLAGALGGGAGDGGNFLKLADLADQELSGLSGKGLNSAYAAFAAEVGTAAAGANAALDAASVVLLTLETQRAAESGVNPDEELLNLERYQSMYEAAARYVSVLSELDDVLLQL